MFFEGAPGLSDCCVLVESYVSYFGDDVQAELVVFEAECFCFEAAVDCLGLWACFVGAFVGVAGDVEGSFEGYDVFLPGDVASVQGCVALWAQVYLWLEVQCFCPAVVFGCFHNSIYVRLQLWGITCEKSCFIIVCWLWTYFFLVHYQLYWRKMGLSGL